MAKRERTAKVLQEELSRRIHRIDEIAEDGACLKVPLPQAHARDARGRNWDIKRIDRATGYERAIRAVIDGLRDEFDLAESTGGTGRPAPANPFD
jgi:hypothetical protein